jgi:hypothetical protein
VLKNKTYDVDFTNNFRFLFAENLTQISATMFCDSKLEFAFCPNLVEIIGNGSSNNFK